MNHVNIEKKCTIILCALSAVSAFFFVIADYGLYDCYKGIIIYHTVRLRALGYKKKYEAMTIEEQPHVYTHVNRAPHYLNKSSASYLYNYGIKEKKNNSSLIRKQVRKKINISKNKSKTGTSSSLQPSKNRNALFKWPLRKEEFWLSSFFGPRKKPDRSWGFHYGIDMAALKGTPVFAAGAGVVTYAGFARGYGNTVLISHSDRYTTRYAHLDTITVSQGTRLCAGRHIGTVGDTGYTITKGKDASHLHFEVSTRGKQVNPLRLLPPL